MSIQTFEQNSSMYRSSYRFALPKVKNDIDKLYDFVALTNNLAKGAAKGVKNFKKLEKLWYAKNPPKGKSELEQVVLGMREISEKYNFDTKWIDSFLDSMRMNTVNTEFKKQKDTLKYMYGSAEVIGLMTLAVLRPDLRRGEKAKEAQYYAKMQGRAMQYIDFVRDIGTDIEQGTTYFAKNSLQFYGLQSLKQNDVRRHQADFLEFVHVQVKLYLQWQAEADKFFTYIPWRERAALRAVVDTNNWVAKKIAADPLVVYSKNVKPSKLRMFSRMVARSVYA